MDDQHRLLLLREALQALEQTAAFDFNSGVWASWPRLVNEFNDLLKRAESLGVQSGISPLENVPAECLALGQGAGAGMPEEKAKVSEIISRAKRLTQIVDMSIDGTPIPDESADPLRVLQRVCGRFHSVACQLRVRHDDRDTLDVADEYDIQDLLHSVLRLFFDDIRPEEWTPSYAGQSTRMDFLLKPERMVVETKKTRKGLGAKETGNELINDIEHYKRHPDCAHLVCFVYDPENRISNPRGLESDLSREENGFSVTVFVMPRND